MSAASMREKGEKTEKKIMAALGKKPKSPAHIAARSKVSPDYARARLAALAEEGKAERVKVSRAIHYRLPANAKANFTPDFTGPG